MVTFRYIMNISSKLSELFKTVKSMEAKIVSIESKLNLITGNKDVKDADTPKCPDCGCLGYRKVENTMNNFVICVLCGCGYVL